jgi:hypothetical protein
MSDPFAGLRSLVPHDDPFRELRSIGSIGAWEATESPNVQKRRKPDGTYEYRPNPAGREGAPGVEHVGGDDREQMLRQGMSRTTERPKSLPAEVMENLAPRVAANIVSMPELPSMLSGLLDKASGRRQAPPGLSSAELLNPRTLYSEPIRQGVEKVMDRREEAADRLAQGMTNAGFSPMTSALADTGLEIGAVALDPTNTLPVVGGAKALRARGALGAIPEAALSREMSLAAQLAEDAPLASFPDMHPILAKEAASADAYLARRGVDGPPAPYDAAPGNPLLDDAYRPVNPESSGAEIGRALEEAKARGFKTLPVGEPWFDEFARSKGYDPGDIPSADEAWLRKQYLAQERLDDLDLRPDIVPDMKGKVFRVGDAEFQQAWQARAYRENLSPETGQPLPELTRERWEQLKAGQTEALAGRLKAVRESVDKPLLAPDSMEAPKPKMGREVAEKYSGERAQIESQIQQASDAGMIPPEQVPELRAQHLKALDAGWHEKVVQAAKATDDPTLAMLADETEAAVMPKIEAPPKRPDGIGPGGAFKPSESGHLKVPHLAPPPKSPMDVVIRYGADPKLPFKQRMQKSSDKWIDQMTNKEEAPVRLLKRAGLTDEAKLLEMYIGKKRGAARVASNVVSKGVRLWDPATQSSRRIADSFESIVGGLDGQAWRDGNDLTAARHHLELAARQEQALLEFDMARARRIQEMRQARLADKNSLRSMAGSIRDARVAELRAARGEAKAQGSYAAFLVSENRARRAGSKRALLSPMEASSDTAAGRLSATQQAAAGAADARPAITSAQRVAMGIRDEATNFRKRFPVVEKPRDASLKIDPEGTRIARETIAELEQRWGTEVDPVTGKSKIRVIEDIAQRVRDWENAAVIDQLDSVGYFTPDRLKILREKNQEHAHFFRLLDDLADDPILAGGSTSQPIKRVSGGLSPASVIAPPWESSVAHAQRIAMWVEKQRVKNLLGDFAEAHADVLGSEIKKVSSANAPDAFQVFRDGQRVLYSAPQDVLNAVDRLTPTQTNIFMQAAVVAARTLRAGATLLPDFALRNFLRDQAVAGVYGAEFKYRPFGDFFTGLWAQTPMGGKLKEVVEQWEAAGGALSDYINLERPQVQLKAHAAAGLVKLPGGRLVRAPRIAKEVANWRAETNVFAKVMYPILRPMEVAGGAVEQATRIGAFQRAKLKGATDLKAANFSRNITLDFGRSGSAVQRWNGVEAFANANIQDVARFSRAMRERPVATMLSAGAYVTIPALAVYWAHKDDPGYQGLPEFEKANFLQIEQRDDGRWVRIPRPQGLINLMFGYGIQKGLEAATEQLGLHPVEELLATVFNETPLRYSPVQPDAKEGGVQGSMEFLPTIAQPAVEVAAGDAGHSSYRDGPIVPKGMVENTLPENRYLDSTTALARKAGQATGIAPLKIDYLIRGYGAGMVTSLIRGGEILAGETGGLPELPATAKDIPGVGGLIGGSPYGFGSQPTQDLYALEKVAVQAANDLKKAAERGNVAEYQRILREHPEALVAKELTKQKDQLSKLRDTRKTIRTVDGMTPENRADALLQIDQAVSQISAGTMHWASDWLRGIRK